MLKKGLNTAIFLGSAVLSLTPAYAENQGYAGGSVAFIEYSEDGIDDDASLTAIFGRFGTNFNENFSGEIRVGVGVGDDSVDAGIDVDVELDTLFGAYLRGGVPVTESIFPYALVGFTRGEVSASVPGFSVSESETDISFGLGLDFSLNDKITLNAEYTSYLDKGAAEISGFSLGVVSKF